MGAVRATKLVAGKGGRPTAAKSKGPSGTAKPALLAGGNPQIAKADDDAPVQAYIAARRLVVAINSAWPEAEFTKESRAARTALLDAIRAAIDSETRSNPGNRQSLK